MDSIEHSNQNHIMTKNELTLKLDRARWHVMQNSPFYGQLMMSLQDVIGNPHGTTACTDGKRIMWSEDFLAGMSDEETRYVLLHETMHCAHAHLWRFPVGKVDHSIANQACDHAINLVLNSADLKIKMPEGGLADSRFTGLAEEEIYAALASQPKQKKGKGKPQPGSGQPDDVCGDYCAPADDGGETDDHGKGKAGQPGDGETDGHGNGEMGETSLEEEWKRNLIQAQIKAIASHGNIPADMERILDRLAVSPIDWRQETAAFARDAKSSRNDWTRSPRRHAWQSVIYPSRKANEIGWIVGVRDTSGSVDNNLAAEFSAILATACGELHCGLILMDCDTAIQAEYRIEPGDEVPLTARGGGGTDFAAPFARCAQLVGDGEKIAGLIYLTDLFGDNFPNYEAIPTLTICTNNNVAPSGRTIQVL